MWLLVLFALTGLALKIWGAHHLRQFWHVPGASVCLIFIVISYAQTVLELYGYFLVRHPSGAELLLLKLYYVFVLATAFSLPTIIDVAVIRKINLTKLIISFFAWLIFSTIIISTNYVITDIKVLPQVLTRVPGPYYGFFPSVALIVVLYCVFRLKVIANRSKDELIKTKAFNIMIGITLLTLTTFSVTLLMRFGIPINAAGILPLSIGLLVLVLAYQFSDVSIFDLRSLLPFTSKWRQLWHQTRHIHTISVDPCYCKHLIDEYTDSLIDAADKVCNNQRDIAAYIGVSQATVSRRARKLDRKNNNR